MKLVIVESPTKAKTISRFLSSDFVVTSSFGHLRDLPKSKMGIDVANNFEPTYVPMIGKKEKIAELKKAAKKSDTIYFATDHDREGEAISWHLAHILDIPEKEVTRIVFHEITKPAILEALQHPEHLKMDMVNAQQARRVLDRLVGYELSPFLWKTVSRGLSAGRVQSVALRLIVEREKEIKAFIPQEYWTIEAFFTCSAIAENIETHLIAVSGKKLEKFAIPDTKSATHIITQVQNNPGIIGEITSKRITRRAAPPFITSTLQQEANHKLGFSSKQTMMLAQQLYEGVELGSSKDAQGLITYMRTDSVYLSPLFIDTARAFIAKQFDKKYVPDAPRAYKSSTKNAQEAHEAIRPTDIHHTPESLRDHLSPQQWKLYDLIWRRTLASQMSAASLELTSVDVDVSGNDKNNYTFRATGSVIVFDGFLVIYPEMQKDKLLPQLEEGAHMAMKEIKPLQHFTEPLPRFSDATIVKALEEYGIGRPSTYAPTLATLEEREYVMRDERKKFVPSEIGIVVTDLLLKHFPSIVDYGFTAGLENELDEISRGEKQWQDVCRAFYVPFKKLLEEKKQEVKKNDVMTEETDRICPECKKPIIIRRGRYGKFYACTGFPECKFTEPFEKKEKIPPKSTGVACPLCTADIVARNTRRGKLFYGCSGYPKCTFALWYKPTGEKCTQCGSMLVEKKDGISCSNKECKSHG